jgi:hypothetical protein
MRGQEEIEETTEEYNMFTVNGRRQESNEVL